jgi:hypothetical protein
MALPPAHGGQVSSAGTGDLLADGSIPMTGNWNFGNQNLSNVAKVLVGTTTDVNALVQVFHATSVHIAGRSSNTNEEPKTFRIGGTHYANATADAAVAHLVSGATTNVLTLGGGSSVMTAATAVAIATAANNTTTTGTERMRVNSAGNVLVNTTQDEGARLQVVGSLANQIELRDTDSDATNKFSSVGSTHYSNSTQPFIIFYGLSTVSQNAARIGGGSAVMTAATQVQQYAAATNTTTTGTAITYVNISGMRVQISATTGPLALLHVASTADSNSLRINDSTGNLGIKQAASSTHALGVTGTSAFSSNVLIGTATSTAGTLQVHADPAATPVDTAGIGAINTTAATAGNQKYSPVIRWRGNGWKTNATAASQRVDFRTYVIPVEGAAAPTGLWVLESSINAGAYTSHLQLSSAGYLNLQSTTFGLGVPKIAGDPATTANGDIWYNTSSHKYKGQENGTVVTFTTS